MTHWQNVKKEFKRDKRRKAVGAGLLVLPAVAFVCLTFVSAIAFFLFKSVDNSVVPDTLPQTTAAIADWSGVGVPDEAVYAALFRDLEQAKGGVNLFGVSRRLNYQYPGFMTLLSKTARRLPDAPEESYKDTLIGIDAKWEKPEIWQLIHKESSSLTSFFLRSTIGMTGKRYGDVSDAGGSAYATTMIRTFWISAVVTLVCLLLGYPLAYLLASAQGKVMKLVLLGLVLTPFWTSLLVRTLAWIVIFSKDGIANAILTQIGVISAPISMLYTRGALYVGMVQILLPFMVLSIYSVMRGISPIYTRAALSLGARPVYAFYSVYLPQTMPGVGAGIVLVGVLALGFYITPMFLGGPHDQMVSYYIAYFTDQNANWGMAASLGVWLLAFTLIAFALVNRFIGVNKAR
ncbi:MAG: ABC transporter permease [Porticoccaceae bacterium]|nr:ABC transporter permease [Porticoccaceae bacterium]